MIERDDMDDENPDMEQEKLEAAFELLKQIESVDKKKGYDCVVRPLRRREKRLRTWRRIAACAAIVFPLIVGGIWWMEKPANNIPLAKTYPIVPGVNKARLVLGNKKEILLDTLTTRDLLVDAGISIRKEGEGVIYESRQQGEEKNPVYNELIVPRGGEYDVILEDGTHVWLNADSKLKYPTVFTGKERRVYLEGEGYFDVARDSTKPFFVETREQSIQVLGTSFNVMNYMDEARVEVALLTGEVNFRDSLTGECLKMMPGDVVRMNKDDRKITVTREDVSLVAAWREGYFYFDNMSMEELVVKLARWYQVDFLFATEKTRRIRFTGAVKKHEPLKDVLGLIEKTGDVRFIDLGGKIKIYQK